MPHSKNGSAGASYLPDQNRRTADHLLYEHGVSLADLAARMTAQEEFRREIKPAISEMQETMAETKQSMGEAIGALKSAIATINTKAWTTWRVMTVGAAVFVAAVGAAAWLADKVGMTIHFGG